MLVFVHSSHGHLRHRMQRFGVRIVSRVDVRAIDVIVWVIFDWSPSTTRIVGCGATIVRLPLIVVLFGYRVDAIIGASLHTLVDLAMVGRLFWMRLIR